LKNTNPISVNPVALCGLLSILLFAGIIRYGLLDVPLERDEGEYAYAGQLILQGIPPYQDVFNMKFPGIYAAYALMMTVFGQSHQGIHAALLLMNTITIVLVFLIARRIGTLLSAVSAAAFFALLSVSHSVLGMSANAEHFVIAFATAGLLFMLQGLEGQNPFRLFIAGFFLGLSATMKQHGLAFTIFATVYIVFDTLKQHPLAWRLLISRLVFFAGGGGAVFGGMYLIMVWTGVSSAFWFWTVDYAAAYVSQMPIGQAWPAFIYKFKPVLSSAPLIWIAAGVGFLGLGIKKFNTSNKVFLLMFALFSALSICPGFYFRSHYFVLLLPCTSLLAGVTIEFLATFSGRLSSGKIQHGLPLLLLALCLMQSIHIQRRYLFDMTPLQICRAYYGLNPFHESIEIADFIKNRTEPEDRIAILGSEPQIFFYSQRRSASSYIYMYPLMENHAYALQMQADFVKNVEAVNPKFLIYVGVQTSWLVRSDSHPKVFQWIDTYIKKNSLRRVGLVEMFADSAVYHWSPNIKWPPRSKQWISIYERPR
jgi:hypothetical protein